MINIQDKKFRNWTNYVTDGWGLTLDTFTYDEAGYVKEWMLCNDKGATFRGETIPELINTLALLKNEYNLKTRECKGEASSKDLLVIYTDNLNKLYRFIKNHNVITDKFSLYFQVMDNIEFRECWLSEDVDTAPKIAHWAQFMIDNLFIIDKYFYLTSNQIVRKRLKRKISKLDNNIAKDIYPDSFDLYNYLRKAHFGGILYVPYPKLVIPDPMIEIDIKSAFPWCLLTQKHCMSVSELAEKDYWEYYTESTSKMAIGKYRITYSSYSKKITCYKNSNGEHCLRGDNITDTFTMTSIDLKNFLDIVNATNVECIRLYEYDLDYLPKHIRDQIVEEYAKKEELKRTKPHSEELALQKVTLNGIYGDADRNWKSVKAYDEDKKNPNFAPQWGILTSSYAKDVIMRLGAQLKGWYYSATDSIFCLDTPENRAKIDEYNNHVRQINKEFCEMFDYDYTILSELGTFDIEEEIIKFRAFGPNSYLFTRKDGSICIKACGCPKSYRNNMTEEEKEALYDKKVDHIPVGDRVHYIFNPEKTSCTINGKTYESNGSEYTIKLTGIFAEIDAIITASRQR